MFEEIQRMWRREGLLKKALEIIGKMFKENRAMYQASISALMEHKEVAIDIYSEDQEINRYEMEIRKKILEHLSVNPKQDVTFSLVLLGVARDVERTGDFSKNIYELASKHPKGLKEGKYFQEMARLKDQVLELFDLTWPALNESDVGKAERAMNLHNTVISKRLDQLIDDLLDDKEIDVKEAVTYALLSRYLKRISAHLKNIASAVSNPFDRIRYVKDTGYVGF